MTRPDPLGGPLAALLARKPVAVADGAMGTSLFARGLETGDSPEFWNVDHPGRIAALHGEFIDAGIDILLTNTFGGSRCRLALHGAENRVAELNTAGARLGRAAADGAGRPVLVAGSIGPTGEIFAPVGRLSLKDGEAAFAEQAAALAAGGVDLLWIETISGAEELTAAVAGAARTGLPVVATMTFDTHGHTMMGLAPAAAVTLSAELAVRLAGFGANCGIGPAQLVATVIALRHAATSLGGDAVIVAKGNCGVPQYHDGHIHYSGTPEVMADYACLCRDAGARIVGGCCGTTPDHMRAVVDALENRPPGPPPDRTAIEAALGPIATAPAATGGRERRRRRRRG